MTDPSTKKENESFTVELLEEIPSQLNKLNQRRKILMEWDLCFIILSIM